MTTPKSLAPYLSGNMLDEKLMRFETLILLIAWLIHKPVTYLMERIK